MTIKDVKYEPPLVRMIECIRRIYISIAVDKIGPSNGTNRRAGSLRGTGSIIAAP